jgi:hypothetical protein
MTLACSPGGVALAGTSGGAGGGVDSSGGSSGGNASSGVQGNTSGGSTGPASSSGGDTTGGNTGGSLCTPDQAFCDGTKLYTCTRSGNDALGYDCVSQGSSTNPGVCVTTCPYGETACCGRQSPLCAAALSGSVSINGNSSSTFSPFSCGAGITTCTFDVSTGVTDTTTCGNNQSVTVGIDRTKTQPGAITMPAAGVFVDVVGGGSNCAAWTGTIQWVDVPSWSLTQSYVQHDWDDVVHGDRHPQRSNVEHLVSETSGLIALHGCTPRPRPYYR